MKTMGFIISLKENERRRTLLPRELEGYEGAENIFIESGYGEVLGIEDGDYAAAGANIVSRQEALRQDIICDVKAGDGEYIDTLQPGQLLFGWIHAAQNRELTELIIRRGLSACAWENMHREGRHVFYENNELAGEAAVLHASICWGRLPQGIKAAVIGRGNTARGALRALNRLGADCRQYDRRSIPLFRQELGEFDMVVNCVLWDSLRKDRIICRSDLGRMKKGSIIVDVSCDKNGAVESSHPVGLDEPIYSVDGVLHYSVDHTPSLFHRSFAGFNSPLIMPYVRELIEERPGSVLREAMIAEKGIIKDESIIRLQKR